MKEVVERLARRQARIADPTTTWEEQSPQVKRYHLGRARIELDAMLRELSFTTIGDADCAAIRKPLPMEVRVPLENDIINRIAAQIIDLWRGILASDGEAPKQDPTPDKDNRNSRAVPLCVDDQLKLAQILGLVMQKHGCLPVAVWHVYSASNNPIFRRGLKSMAQDIIDEIVKAEGKVFTEDAIDQTEPTPAPLSAVGRDIKSTFEKIFTGNVEPYLLSRWSVLNDPGAVPPVPLQPASPAIEQNPGPQGCANCQWVGTTPEVPGELGRSHHPLYCTWTKHFWPSPLPWEPRIYMRPGDGFMCATWKRKGTDV